jgi:hypothetical protein
MKEGITKVSGWVGGCVCWLLVVDLFFLLFVEWKLSDDKIQFAFDWSRDFVPNHIDRFMFFFI